MLGGNYLFVTSALLFFRITKANEDIAIDYTFSFVQKNLTPYEVNIIINDSRKLSPFASKIVRMASQSFGSNILHIESDWQDFEVEVCSFNPLMDNEHGPKRMRNMYCPGESINDVIRRNSKRAGLAMGMVDVRHGLDILREMRAMLHYFHYYNPLIRGKYLIHLVCAEQVDLESFFRFAWSQKFLDITVIEWIQDRRGKFARINSTQSGNYRVHAHSFNPFTNILRREILSIGTKLFPVKDEDLNRFPLNLLTTEFEDSRHRTDIIALMDKLAGAINCEIHAKTAEEVFIPMVYPSKMDTIDIYWQSGDEVLISHYGMHDSEWDTYETSQVRSILLPGYEVYFHYLRRPIDYDEEISAAAILTFAGLFYTAFIFAMWSKLLGFKERNWSFLNILTAQMGGSLQHRGPMKLSEMIFQMSIYVATFIVVTLGTDYMLEIFIKVPRDLPEIKTLNDIAESNINLTTAFDAQQIDWSQFGMKGRIYSTTAYKYYDNHRPRTFCELPARNSQILDETVNFCASTPDEVMASDARFQVDRIEYSIPVVTPSMRLEKFHSFFKGRFEYLIGRFLAGGLIEEYSHSPFYNRTSRKQRIESTNDGNDEVDKVPPQKQLYPILAIGYILGIAAFICEWIWKCLVQRTEFGKLVGAFYSDSRPRTPETHTMRMNRSSVLDVSELGKSRQLNAHSIAKLHLERPTAWSAPL